MGCSHPACLPHTCSRGAPHKFFCFHAAVMDHRAWLLSVGMDTQLYVVSCTAHTRAMKASAAMTSILYHCVLKALASISVALSVDLCGQPPTSVSCYTFSLLRLDSYMFVCLAYSSHPHQHPPRVCLHFHPPPWYLNKHLFCSLTFGQMPWVAFCLCAFLFTQTAHSSKHWVTSTVNTATAQTEPSDLGCFHTCLFSPVELYQSPFLLLVRSIWAGVKDP